MFFLRILHKRGPEYTNKIINRAAVCIQRWTRGWLVRKELEKLKNAVFNKLFQKEKLFLNNFIDFIQDNKQWSNVGRFYKTL